MIALIRPCSAVGNHAFVTVKIMVSWLGREFHIETLEERQSAQTPLGGRSRGGWHE